MIKINKSKFDNKNIFGGILDNNIKYILINDNNLDKSYISVSINIGSYHNPKHYEGLAHFLEHMLFLGSIKYPKINYFSDKLNEFGGSSNAYTDNLETVYYFNVYTTGLKEIIDIFSRFFIDPLFDKTSIDKEINAINNEYLKNINNDNWKISQFINNIYNSDSLINTFSTGSKETLNKSDILEKMLHFYNTNYISNNIGLCIASSLSINELYNIINESFGLIKKQSNEDNNKFLENNKKIIIKKPLLSENMNKTFYLKSVAEIYNLIYIWEIPIQEEYLYTKDFDILSLLLLDKSPNNLYFNLINEGYINDIYIETLYEGLFIINISLSLLGYENIDYIDNILFSYLEYIYTLDLNKYAKYYKKINKILFYNIHNYNINSLCNLLSTNLHYYKIKDVYSCLYLIYDTKTTEEYKNLYKNYINKNNFIKIIQSNNIKTDLYNDFYKNEYKKSNNIFKYIKISNNIINNFNINIDNPYLNIKSKIIKNLDLYKNPKIIGNKQWFGAITKFNEPIIYIWIKMYNDILFINPKNYILTCLSCTILNYLITIILNKPLNILCSCYLSYNSSLNSIYLNISSINDIKKLKIFIDNIYNFILNIKKYLKLLSKTYINNIIEEYKLNINNIIYYNPWEYNDYIFNYNINICEYNNELLLKNMSKINYNNIIKYIIELNILNTSIITTFLYGNIKNKYNNLLNIFHNNNNIHNIIYYDIILFDDIIINHPNKNEKSNCVTYYYNVGTFSPLNYLLLNLTINILNEWFYDKLRTKYQLGYLVSMHFIKNKDYYFIIQKIQSLHPINLVELKINKFNNNILNKINDLDITNYIISLKNNLLEKYYTMNQQINVFIYEINNEKYFFNRKEILLQYIDKINKTNLIEFIKTFIINNKCTKIKINGN